MIGKSNPDYGLHVTLLPCHYFILSRFTVALGPGLIQLACR